MCLGIPGQIVAITDAERQLALADIAGVRREVSVACVAGESLDGLVGAWTLIHVGFAMALIDEGEAAATLATLVSLGETREALEAIESGARALAQTP